MTFATIPMAGDAGGATDLSTQATANRVCERNSAHMWVPMADTQSGKTNPQFLPGTTYNFQYRSGSSYADTIRIILRNVDLMFHVATEGTPRVAAASQSTVVCGDVILNRGGLLTLFGQNFQATLKDTLWDMQHVAGLSLIMRTFSSNGLNPNFGGYGWEFNNPSLSATNATQPHGPDFIGSDSTVPLGGVSEASFAPLLNGNLVMVDAGNSVTPVTSNIAGTQVIRYQENVFPLYWEYDNSVIEAPDTADAYIHNYVTWTFDIPLTLLKNGAQGADKTMLGGDWDGILPTDSDSPFSITFTSSNASDLIGPEALRNLLYVSDGSTGRAASTSGAFAGYDDTVTPSFSIPPSGAGGTGLVVASASGNSRYQVRFQNSIEMRMRVITRVQAVTGGNLPDPMPGPAFVIKEFAVSNLLYQAQLYQFVNRGSGYPLIKCVMVFQNAYTHPTTTGLYAKDNAFGATTTSLPFGLSGTPFGAFGTTIGIKQLSPSFSFGKYFE